MNKCLAGLALCTAVTVGCATTAYKRNYIIGSSAVAFIETGASEYNDRANNRLDECNPETNPESKVSTKSEFDACMGPYNVKVQTKIVQALGSLRALATAYSAVMLGCVPNADGTKVGASCVKKVYTTKELREWRGKIVGAAFDAVTAFPDAASKTSALTNLIGPKEQ